MDRSATVVRVKPFRIAFVVLGAITFAFAMASETRVDAAAGKRPELVRLSGEALRAELLDPPGRVRLLHLWASWCVPCRAELPLLGRELRARKRAALDVVLLALDDAEGQIEAARLLRRAGVTRGRLRCALPLEAGPHLLRIDPQWDGGVPTSYLLDPQGSLLFAQRGLTILPELLAKVDTALEKK